MGAITIVSDNAGWRAILLTAVEGTSAEPHLQPVLAQLDIAFADAELLMPSRVRAMYVDSALSEPLLTRELALALDTLDGDRLSAARAVLACLPDVLAELGEAVTGGDVFASALLDRLLALENAYSLARMAPRQRDSVYTCPRCASGHIREEHRSEFGGLHITVHCELCRAAAEFDVGGRLEQSWLRSAS